MRKALILLVVLGPVVSAQPAPPALPAGFSASLVASGLPTNADWMEVDATGAVYIGHSACAGVWQGGVTVVQPGGSAGLVWSDCNRRAGQLARSPLSGTVFHITRDSNDVHRLAVFPPGGGAPAPFGPLLSLAAPGTSAAGLAIDAADQFLAARGGVWRLAGTAATAWTSTGIGGSGTPMGIARDGALWIGQTFQVQRVPAGTTAAQTVQNRSGWYPVSLFPSEIGGVGPGMFVAWQTQSATPGTLELTAYTLSGTPIPFLATISFPSSTLQKARAAGSGDRNLFVLAGGSLWRITQDATSALPGAMNVSFAPGLVIMDLYGYANAPFLLAADAPGATSGWIPLYGPLATTLGTGAAFIPLLDGIGLFSSPHPLAVLDASGHRQIQFPLPVPLAVVIQVQSCIASSQAPNLLFLASNALTLAL